MTTTLERPVTREAVETFLYEEAALADAHRYEDWLALWAPDAFYWAPANDDDADQAMHLALLHDDYAGLQHRVLRLGGEFIHSQNPRTRLSRSVNNIRFHPRDDGLVEVHAVFHIVAFRAHKFETVAGRNVFWLRPEGGSFKLVRKEIYLVNNDGYLPNMTYLL